jgi:hypothetical protein
MYIEEQKTNWSVIYVILFLLIFWKILYLSIIFEHLWGKEPGIFFRFPFMKRL